MITLEMSQARSIRLANPYELSEESTADALARRTGTFREPPEERAAEEEEMPWKDKRIGETRGFPGIDGRAPEREQQSVAIGEFFPFVSGDDFLPYVPVLKTLRF